MRAIGAASLFSAAVLVDALEPLGDRNDVATVGFPLQATISPNPETTVLHATTSLLASRAPAIFLVPRVIAIALLFSKRTSNQQDKAQQLRECACDAVRAFDEHGQR